MLDPHLRGFGAFCGIFVALEAVRWVDPFVAWVTQIAVCVVVVSGMTVGWILWARGGRRGLAEASWQSGLAAWPAGWVVLILAAFVLFAGPAGGLGGQLLVALPLFVAGDSEPILWLLVKLIVVLVTAGWLPGKVASRGTRF